MPRRNEGGYIKIYERDDYVYYLATITVLRKNHRKYFKFNDEGKILAEDWLKVMRLY